MTLDLTGDVTTLIGLNESGKTTILEAMFCFSYGAEDLEVLNPSLASLRVPDRWIPIAKRANFNDTIKICATVSLSDADKAALRTHLKHEAGFTTGAIADEIRICENHRFQDSRFETTERLWTVGITGTQGRQRKVRSLSGSESAWQVAVDFIKARLPRIWYFPNFLFDLPERFTLAAAASETLDEEQDRSAFYRATFEAILGELGSGANLETHVVGRLESDERADQRSLNDLLLQMGRVVTNTVFEGWNRIFGGRPSAQEVELEADVESDEAYLGLRIKGADGYYDLSERSLGFRWFFMFILLTSFQGLDDDGPPPLFLLDEPASNLHSTAQAELLKSFENLAAKCHLVYTTHSHHLINVRWLDAAYVVKNSALKSLGFEDYVNQHMAANTSITATPYRRFVAEHPDQTSYFQPVLDLLEYKPSLVEPVPDVVLTEGKSDFYLFRYAIDVLSYKTDLRFVPSTGAGSLAPLIQLHIGWSKSFLILLDGDKEGTKQGERYEKEFGPLVRDRIVYIPNIAGDEKAQRLEDLLTEASRERVVTSIFPNSDSRPSPKKAFSQAIMELYAADTKVPLDPTSSARIRRALSDLHEMMDEQAS